MSIHPNVYEADIQRIVTEQSAVGRTWRYSARLKVGEQWIDPLKLLSLDVLRQYSTGYGDTIFTELVFGLGTYEKHIAPNKLPMQLTITAAPIHPINNTGSQRQPAVTQVYHAFLVNVEDYDLEKNTPHGKSEEASNLLDLKTVRFQLVEAALSQLRLIQLGGVYRKISAAELLKTLLMESSSQLPNVPTPQQISGVDLAVGFAEDKLEQIVIPHGLPLTELPEFLQADAAGIYSTGLGYFLQAQRWYIYPLFDLTAYTKAPRTLRLFNLPAYRYPGIEFTYRKTDREVQALCTGQSIVQDVSESRQLNEGSGLRFADARKIMDGWAKVENNTITATRKQNTTETLLTERPTGQNFAPVAKSRITANTLQALSVNAARLGRYVTTVWENADPHAVFPGMPVRYQYEVEGKARYVDGIVHSVQHFIAPTTPGAVSINYRCQTALLLFVKAETSLQTQPPAQTPMPALT